MANWYKIKGFGYIDLNTISALSSIYLHKKTYKPVYDIYVTGCVITIEDKTFSRINLSTLIGIKGQPDEIWKD